jgi:adenosylmethionine-8-amino-7-oxononanoate aminotransferase
MRGGGREGAVMDAETPDLAEAIRHVIMDLRQMKSFCERPLVIERARGVELFAVDGKRYLDGISGIYVVNVGHGNAAVIEAMRAQQDRVSFVAPLHAVSDTCVRYAAKLSEITPPGLGTFKLVSSGSEATETAIKFARQFHRQSGNPGKYKVISLYKGYHGATLGALSATGLGGPRKSVFGPFLEGFVHLPPPLCFHCPYRLSFPACECLCARMVEYAIRSEGPESVAALILEPIGNTGGIVVPPPPFLPMIRDICTRHQVLLIFDELITGMGRTGNWFAAQTFGVVPDLLCMGKGMSSGYAPLAAVAILDELYYSAFWGEEEANIHFAHGHTYGGNPVSAAAGAAVIDVIRSEGLLENGTRIGNRLRERLSQEVGDQGVLGEVRGAGCLVGVELVEDQASRRPFPATRRFGKRLERRLLDAGLILRCDPDWIAFAPPLTTTLAQADEMVDLFAGCLRKEMAHGS